MREGTPVVEPTQPGSPSEPILKITATQADTAGDPPISPEATQAMSPEATQAEP